MRKMKLLLSNTLSVTTTAADVKALVDSFFETEVSWENFKHTCTDSVPAIIGVKSGFVTLVKNEWPHVTFWHCSLHRYTLASKTLPPHLMEVMDVAVKVINFIRSRAKNCQLFQLLAKAMGAQHVGLLFYTKIQWLSRGTCLSRLYELKNKVEIFLQENRNNLHVKTHNEEFVVLLT